MSEIDVRTYKIIRKKREKKKFYKKKRELKTIQPNFF